MEIKASIIYDKKVDTPKYDVTGTSLFLDCFEVEIITNGSETFEELISNKEAITEAINRYNESGFTDELGEDEQITDLSFLDTLKDNITYIRIDASDEEYNDYIGCLEWNREIPFEEKQEWVDEYLQFHPEYKNYTLLINDRVDTSTDMEEIREKYKDYKDILLNPKDSEVLISM